MSSASPYSLFVLLLLSCTCTHALILPSARAALRLPVTHQHARSYAVMMGKKGGKPKGAKSGGGGGGRKGQGQQQKAKVAENKLDAQLTGFMFTILGLTKTLPDGSRTLIKNISEDFRI